MTASDDRRPPPVHGYLNFYKPVNMTSMDAVRRIKRITGQRKKVGHAGTMDPLAHGVLPICFGQGTRLMDYIIQGVKRYQTEVELGVSTSTYDAEGEVTKRGEVSHLTREQVSDALQSFIGLIEQRPPMYSAVKVQGQRLYKLARAGIEVERKPRSVEIHDITLVDFSLPKITLDVECGKGVYIRSLAHDLGEALGCGGYVSSLVRLSCGGFDSADSVTLEQLEEANEADQSGWHHYLHPIDRALGALGSITVPPPAEKRLLQGQPISIGRQMPAAGYLEQFRAYAADGRFLALVSFDRSNNSWQPVKVFHNLGPSPYAPASRPS